MEIRLAHDKIESGRGEIGQYKYIQLTPNWNQLRKSNFKTFKEIECHDPENLDQFKEFSII